MNWIPGVVRNSFRARFGPDTYQIDMNVDGNWTACRLSGRRVVGIGHYYDTPYQAANACCRSAGTPQNRNTLGRWTPMLNRLTRVEWHHRRHPRR